MHMKKSPIKQLSTIIYVFSTFVEELVSSGLSQVVRPEQRLLAWTQSTIPHAFAKKISNFTL